MMKSVFFLVIGLLASLGAHAADNPAIPLKHISLDLSDKAALYRGAQTFQAMCETCHNADNLRYERLAQDLSLSKTQLDQLLPPGAKPGDVMHGFMPAEYAQQVFGVVPPDLTLIARVKGADWLYTYLTSFYADPAKRWGVNNAVFPGVGMPNVFAAEQGVQEPIFTTVKLPDGTTEQRLSGLKAPTIPGNMPPAEFEQQVRDLVAFMVYMAEPARMQRMHYGPYVLAFLLLFTVLMYFVKKEYWRDVPKGNKAT
ncbi:cytochrome c1 [Halothiobacillus sp. DCM-1]|uniref:cytochrome c1 n=1 Tax=Halothiobacillus sp. DCM-1 TaxID=3112558 RepID=UPI00324C5BD4